MDLLFHDAASVHIHQFDGGVTDEIIHQQGVVQNYPIVRHEMRLCSGAAPSTADPPEEDVVVEVLGGQVVVTDLLD